MMKLNKYLTTILCTQLIYLNDSRADCLFNDDLNEYSVISGMEDAEANGWTHYTDFGVDSWRVIPGSGVAFSNAFGVAEETPPSLLGITDSFLVTPVIHLTGNYRLTFSHKYDFEADSSYYDGGQLQISNNNGNSWSDLNQYIIAGGYNEVISNSFASPIRGQLAWAGEQDQFSIVQVNLNAFANQNIQIRWRFASGVDSSAQLGWKIDSINISEFEGTLDTLFSTGFELSDCP